MSSDFAVPTNYVLRYIYRRHLETSFARNLGGKTKSTKAHSVGSTREYFCPPVSKGVVVGVLKESDHMGGGGAGGSYQPPPVSLDSARFRPASVRLKKLLSCI